MEHLGIQIAVSLQRFAAVWLAPNSASGSAKRRLPWGGKFHASPRPLRQVFLFSLDVMGWFFLKLNKKKQPHWLMLFHVFLFPICFFGFLVFIYFCVFYKRVSQKKSTRFITFRLWNSYCIMGGDDPISRYKGEQKSGDRQGCGPPEVGPLWEIPI